MSVKIQGSSAEGYSKFQFKVGGNANDETERIHATRSVLKHTDLLMADANTSWTLHGAARVINASANLDVYIEQPCMIEEESISIRKRTSLAFILDEVIDGTDTLIRVIAEGAMDVINLKHLKLVR
jgi:L-alanine-DL-glutamate epimerase-like enolase superfamily enzyme